MLFIMRVRSSRFRILIVLLSALAVMIAAPLHASHDHGGTLDGPCAICKSHTTACGPSALECAGPLLQPVGVLASDCHPAVATAPRTLAAPRAPPVSLA